MKSYHILAALHGEQDSQAALLRMDDIAHGTIHDARRALAIFAAEKGGSASIRHFNTYHIHLLSGIPDGFVPDLDAADMTELYGAPILLADLDEPAFLAAAEAQGVYQPSEVTGLLIYPDALYILGHEKHGKDCIESHDVHDLELTEVEQDARQQALAAIAATV